MYGHYKYFEESSSTSAACCQKCNEKIKKGEPRLGEVYRYYRYDGIRWTHLKCVSLKDILSCLDDIAKLVMAKISLEEKDKNVISSSTPA